jgi:hypothetical protein
LIRQAFSVLLRRKLSGVFRNLHADLIRRGSLRLFWCANRPSLHGLVSYGLRWRYHCLSAEAATLGERARR